MFHISHFKFLVRNKISDTPIAILAFSITSTEIIIASPLYSAKKFITKKMKLKKNTTIPKINKSLSIIPHIQTLLNFLLHLIVHLTKEKQ
ncbi:hypothetical protein AWH56_26825 [Anaerobacillus isosaccharinicus]|uniref:Uncharacterized protein n=1 Tax=Anaerobacillus isosaccharinicus TaxID=1532552 RepID=A0AC62A4H3_9BACI|nr:hypothetical protein [Anaerobacillus isosaccharinicus]